MVSEINSKLPSIIVTGASGFVGRHFLEVIKDKYNIFAIARRSQSEAAIPFHHNIHWIQCDIGSWARVKEVINLIKENGGADYILHLAAFYDFEYTDKKEYENTNVKGTQYILDMAKSLKIKRFIFASSLAACNFPPKGKVVNEKTKPDANFAYAKSKKAGEKLVEEYSKDFPCTVTRFAAIFSDWCEYPPLYKFLSTWLAKKWDSRILGGKGESAVSYIHVHDVNKFLLTVLKKSKSLPEFDIYNVSPNGSVSHKELYKTSTLYFFGQEIKPIYFPKSLTYPGLFVRNCILANLHIIKKPFEKFWMLKYVDIKLNVDSSYTFERISWAPTSRYHIKRRLLFIIEKMKSHPEEWHVKNEIVLKRITERPNLIIYDHLIANKDKLIEKLTNHILDSENDNFTKFRSMKNVNLQFYINVLYHLLLAAVRSGDRGLMVENIDDIINQKFAEGFEPDEISKTFTAYKEIIVHELINNKELKVNKQDINDSISLTIQLVQDGIEDIYENLDKKIPSENVLNYELMPDSEELQRKVRQLSAFYQIFRKN